MRWTMSPIVAAGLLVGGCSTRDPQAIGRNAENEIVESQSDQGGPASVERDLVMLADTLGFDPGGRNPDRYTTPRDVPSGLRAHLLFLGADGEREFVAIIIANTTREVRSVEPIDAVRYRLVWRDDGGEKDVVVGMPILPEMLKAKDRTKLYAGNALLGFMTFPQGTLVEGRSYKIVTVGHFLNEAGEVERFELESGWTEYRSNSVKEPSTE